MLNKKIRDIIHGPFSKIIPDKMYIILQYYYMRHTLPNLKRPVLLDEKLQWLKLYDRKPIYTTMVDKFAVKDYVANIIGEKYLIKTLGVWEKGEDIDFESLPDQFVLKTTHDSHGLRICKDKSTFDCKEAQMFLQERLNHNFFWYGREWPYKNVKPRIIAEEYIQNADGTPVVDYKFYSYGGEPRYFMYSVGEAEHEVRNHKFDLELNSIDYLFKDKEAISISEIQLPPNIDEMIEIVKKLSVGFKHIRVDLYNVDGRIYFGELTFSSSSGYMNIKSNEYKQWLAGLIDIP